MLSQTGQSRGWRTEAFYVPGYSIADTVKQLAVDEKVVSSFLAEYTVDHDSSRRFKLFCCLGAWG